MLSSGWFTGVCNLNANVSEHSVCSIFSPRLWSWNRVFRKVGIQTTDAGESPRRKHTTFRTRRKVEIIHILVCMYIYICMYMLYLSNARSRNKQLLDTFFSRYIVIGKFTTLDDPHRINYVTFAMMMVMPNSVKSDQIKILSHLSCVIFGIAIYCSLQRESHRLGRRYCLHLPSNFRHPYISFIARNET
jgi:hypothetical protein